MNARYAIGIGARSGVDAQEAAELIQKVYETYVCAPSPACGRTQPGAAGSDEGSSSPQRLEGMNRQNPHPSPLRGPTFSHAWEKESRTMIVLFTIDAKRVELGLHEAARLLDTTIVFLPLEALLARKDDLLTHSPLVEALTGVGSVAEAAALVGAGPGSVLLGPRLASARATCAIARNALEVAP